MSEIDWPEEFLNARVQFWMCPVDHEVRKGTNGFPLQTVEWRGDVAHCLEPGCGKTSADETPGSSLRPPRYPHGSAAEFAPAETPEGTQS